MKLRHRRMRAICDPGVVGEAIGEHSATYGPGSTAWSPILSADLDSLGRPEYAYQMDSPEKATQGTPAVKVPRPPLPNVGGEPGRSQPLGWTNGMLPFRTFHQPFRGAVLVRSTMGAHPAIGPVGRSSRQDRLQAGVRAMQTVYLPSSQQVRDMFTTPPSPRNRNPLMEMMGNDE